MLQAQKYLITLCTESAGLSLAQIHRESVSALTNELNKIGFNLRGLSGIEDLERSLYSHYIGHPLGIGRLSLFHCCEWMLSCVIDLHESSHFERSRSYVLCSKLYPGLITYYAFVSLVGSPKGWSSPSNQASTSRHHLSSPRNSTTLVCE